MKIYLDDVEIFDIDVLKQQVLAHDINRDQLQSEISSRIRYLMSHLYDQAVKRIKDEWDVKFIANGVSSVPTNIDDYLDLVFEQPNYQDKKAREL